MSHTPSPGASKAAGMSTTKASPANKGAGICPPLPRGAMTAENTQATITRAIKYIDKFLQFQGVEERFSTLTNENVEGDHFRHLWNNLNFWFATTTFPVKSPSGFMVQSGKESTFRCMKTAFHQKFPNHDLFRDDRFWSASTSSFVSKSANARINDSTVVETRSSRPLYRKNSPHLIRQKWRGEDVIDAVSVAFAYVLNATPPRLAKLAEFTISRNSVGRGGEHVFLRYCETWWDDYFNAIDVDWKIIKQNDEKCSLQFMDFDEPYLCSFFGLAVYFLTGGLRREGISSLVSDFWFPYLHNITKNAVAKGLTKSMQRILTIKYGQKQSSLITSKSTRKGLMTENRANPYLSSAEEYARSGHTAPEHNTNAEGYIGSTPALSAPAGRAGAGYSDPHQECYPMSFQCITNEIAVSSIDRLVEHMFENDVDLLKAGQRLRVITTTCAARLVGVYNKLYKDLNDAKSKDHSVADPEDNIIVQRIREAAKKAAIEDPTIPVVPGVPRHITVLRKWSSTLTDDFRHKNPSRVATEASMKRQMGGMQTQMQELQTQVQTLTSKV
jgi:hypothetical protein